MPAEEAAAVQRGRILAVLPEVVAEHGFSGMTVAHIVAAAGVGRGAFYQQFKDKHESFAVAHRCCHERLQGALTFPCYAKSTLEERVRSSLAAALGLLAEEPAMAVLLAVEAPGAGLELARSHLEWLGRYGALLRRATVGLPAVSPPPAAAELMITGGVATAVAQKTLAGETAQLAELTPEYTEFVLSFYERSR